MKTAVDRFMDKVWPEALSGCWIWAGAVDQHGYGCMTVNMRNVRAHRFALSEIGGVNIDGLDALHHCDNPSCVNPGHLFAGTAQDNIDDMFSKGRNPPRMRTHCKRGHELSGDNVYVLLSGKGRACKACQAMRAKTINAAKPKKGPKPLAKFCGKGHEFTSENTYTSPKGQRQCKECRRVIGNRADKKRRNPKNH